MVCIRGPNNIPIHGSYQGEREALRSLGACAWGGLSLTFRTCLLTDSNQAPGGSSTGPAVAVAAGYSPLAMAAETIGSIVTPSVRTALFALKPTHGVQEVAGMYRMTEFFDTPGPMGKCAADVTNLSELLLGRSLRSADTGTWKGLSVGFVDPGKWKMAEAMCEQFDGTQEQVVSLAHTQAMILTNLQRPENTRLPSHELREVEVS